MHFINSIFTLLLLLTASTTLATPTPTKISDPQAAAVQMEARQAPSDIPSDDPIAEANKAAESFAKWTAFTQQCEERKGKPQPMWLKEAPTPEEPNRMVDAVPRDVCYGTCACPEGTDWECCYNPPSALDV